jgi:hypothetical protein
MQYIRDAKQDSSEGKNGFPPNACSGRDMNMDQANITSDEKNDHSPVGKKSCRQFSPSRTVYMGEEVSYAPFVKQPGLAVFRDNGRDSTFCMGVSSNHEQLPSSVRVLHILKILFLTKEQFFPFPPKRYLLIF